MRGAFGCGSYAAASSLAVAPAARCAALMASQGAHPPPRPSPNYRPRRARPVAILGGHDVLPAMGLGRSVELAQSGAPACSSSSLSASLTGGVSMSTMMIADGDSLRLSLVRSCSYQLRRDSEPSSLSLSLGVNTGSLRGVGGLSSSRGKGGLASAPSAVVL